MKIKHDFEVVYDEWTDPGDYPNALGARPLRAKPFVSGLRGTCRIVRDSPAERWPSLDALIDMALEAAPVYVKDWSINVLPDDMTLEFIPGETVFYEYT